MLDRYWPDAAQVNACIKNEAETAHVSVLLAVHQPSLLTTRSAVTNIETPATEQQLLDAFLTENVPGGALLAPITGPSGVGKSHVIRWLDAQLQRSPKADKLHIIRIPKSASLRTVVELILAPLASDPRYAKAREDLTRAVAAVDSRSAVVLFRAQLENALTARLEQMTAELRDHRERGSELRPLMGHAKSLPLLFSDAALSQHFAEKVLSRVVARALEGQSEEEAATETTAQFFEDDLIVPDDVNLGEASAAVRNYYHTQLAVGDASRRKVAVDLLNSVVDTAIGNVFQLEHSTGGMTLQDIILGVRKLLFEDGRDLVLLIEDFAALAGIQDVLLKVCIQEGEYDGKKVRATMRTALALTDGYLSSRDTILTRAQRVWVLGSRQQSEGEIKAAVVEMAGAYLNAARWGAENLRERFADRSARAKLGDWLPTWQDEGLTDDEVATLGAFGMSAAGDPLFPFNRLALEQLAQRHLMEGGRLNFNPRRVVNEILRETLLLRGAFEAGAFPVPEFQGIRPNAYLAGLVSASTTSEPVKRRLNSALAVWGGNAPNEASLALVPPAVFAAFGLPTPGDLANVAFTPRGGEEAPDTSSGRDGVGIDGAQPPREAAESAEITAWKARLEEWSAGTPLAQAEARALRNALGDLLEASIDWPALRLPKQELKASWLSIANARNNPSGGRQLVVCTDYRDESGALRAGFLGAIRYTLNDMGWSYPEADADYVAVAAIVDDLMRQLAPLLRDEIRTQTAALGKMLTTQARVAGLSPPVRVAGAEGVLRGLFQPIPPITLPSSGDDWDDLRGAILGYLGPHPARERLQTLLLERTASFQGTGKKPFAIDSTRIVEALSAEGALTAGSLEGLPEDVRSFMTAHSETRLWNRLQAVIGRLRDFHDQVSGMLDATFDKADFLNDLKDVIALLQQTNAWPRGSSLRLSEFEPRLTEFQTSPVADLVSKTSLIVSEAGKEETPKLLNALGTLDLGLINRTMSFLSAVNELLDLSEPGAAQAEAARAQADPVAIADEIVGLLKVVAADEGAV